MLAHYAEHVSQRQAECKLPNELLLLVKEYIPLADLRTHVCYYHTCKTVASFYGDNSQQAEFWRRSCTLAGIGWLKADSSWKEIAFETIAKDGFCSHPRCGGALLDWNAQQAELAMRKYNWDPEEGAWDAMLDPEDAREWTVPGHPIPIFNPIFQDIKFKSEHLPPWFHDPYDAKFRVNDPDAPLTYVRQLSAHPVAIRSLATFPSVRHIKFHAITLGHEHLFRNLMGLTVWDIVRGFQSDLDRELSITELLNLLSGPFADIFRDRSSSDFIGDLERFSTLRGLWSATRWEGAYFLTSNGEGPVFMPTFIRLPPAARDSKGSESSGTD
ncbi:hypothetical protein PsYK624_062010 [Phanerochaete sordida]|uniref:Uncharacterized protein n=1 Tax=Phanerochaete sordida TaxID=48140 RepID=A0A9P3G6C1_9APHY|nr:hypothetical protein PsYK624_062010 [Phanerochaete sordida]